MRNYGYKQFWWMCMVSAAKNEGGVSFSTVREHIEDGFANGMNFIGYVSSKISKISKIFKNFKNFENFQKFQKFQKFPKFQKFQKFQYQYQEVKL